MQLKNYVKIWFTEFLYLQIFWCIHPSFFTQFSYFFNFLFFVYCQLQTIIITKNISDNFKLSHTIVGFFPQLPEEGEKQINIMHVREWFQDQFFI